MNKVLQWRIGLLLFSFCSVISGQQEYNNYDVELEASTLIVKYPNKDLCEGSIEISVNGGKAPYTYSIDAGNTFTETNNPSGLCSQKYFIHVRDTDGKLGLTLVNLNPPKKQSDPFTPEEKEAIRLKMIEDLKTEKANYQIGSISARKVDWKLWKLSEPISTEIVKQSVENNKAEYTIAVLVPPTSSSAQYDSELLRIKEQFNDLNIDLVADYGTWFVTVKVDATASISRITELMNHFGFSSYSIKDNTSK